MQMKNPKKTIKVLYLYMTVPLLCVAGIMWVLSSFTAEGEMSADKPEASLAISEPDIDAGDPGYKSLGPDVFFCEVDDDCGIGEVCTKEVCTNPLLIILTTPKPPKVKPEEKKKDRGISGTGWAAIIAAITGGLTGLIGAITQAMLAFISLRERRRAR